MGSLSAFLGMMGVGLGQIIQTAASKPSTLDQAANIINKIVVPVINAIAKLF